LIGFGCSWVFLSFIAYLLIKVVLKRPTLNGKQRLQALCLGLVACVFMAVCGFSTWSFYKWSPVYTQPPVVSIDGLEPGGDTWGRFRGFVSDESRLNLADQGYTVYVEFDSGMPGNRGVRWVAGEGLIIEFEDGTKLDVPKLHYAADHNWNWHDESNFRFLRAGDAITVPGFVYKLSEKSKTGATYRITDGEFFYRGTEADYLESDLKSWKTLESYADLVLTVLFGFSLALTTFGLLTRAKPPSLKGAVAEAAD
jgi:hypothetical protein